MTVRINYDDYDALPCLRWSTLAAMRVSPLYYRYRTTTPRTPTPALILGIAVHSAVLTPEEFAREYVVYRESKTTGPGARTKWRDFQEAHDGAVILDAKIFAAVIAMRDAVLAHPTASRYLAAVEQTERAIQWEYRGRTCKARLDACSASTIAELKSTRSVDSWSFGRDVLRYGYHGQLAWYSTGLRILGEPERRAVIISVESTAPYDVAVDYVPATDLERGKALVDKLLDRLEDCELSGHWPGRADAERVLQLPPDYDDNADDLVCADGNV